MSAAIFEEQLARKDAALRRFERLAAGALLVTSLLSLVLGFIVGFAIGSAPAMRTRADQLILLAQIVIAVFVGALEFRAYREGRSPLSRWCARPPGTADDTAARTRPGER
ncbi:hypothetical protein ACIHEI_18550 [Kitasatospora sp. NPDC051984]|uniref:hypothetical protein n=1 Tax=Kitasatospora sp. NPDC051984 TaxID=3364059 RepID=UPI0037CC03DF